MKPAGVLLDENVSARLRGSFDMPVFHVREWTGGLKDWALWERAREESLVVVTQDADFTERMLAQEPPPWVVHVRTGNMRVADFRALLDTVWPRVWDLLTDHIGGDVPGQARSGAEERGPRLARALDPSL